MSNIAAERVKLKEAMRRDREYYRRLKERTDVTISRNFSMIGENLPLEVQ
jgi:hypothetical protein